MAWQLIYTSAPRLLEAGRSGFGTVARHPEINPLLVAAVERMSQYARGVGYTTGRVIYSHRLITLPGGTFHVLSCIRDAGADYTGRTNHLAHHLIFGPSESATLRSSPAEVMLNFPWLARWADSPRTFTSEDEVNLSGLSPMGVSAGSAWTSLTGDKANASLLSLSPAFVIAQPDADLLRLYAESLQLLRDRCWQLTFTTSLQPSEEAVDYLWLGLEQDSPLRDLLLSTSRVLLDLTDPARLPAPGGSRPTRVEARPSGPTIQKARAAIVPPQSSSHPVEATGKDPFCGYQERRPRQGKVLQLIGGLALVVTLAGLGSFFYQQRQEKRARVTEIVAIAQHSGFYTEHTVQQLQAAFAALSPEKYPQMRALARAAAQLASAHDFTPFAPSTALPALQTRAKAAGLNLPEEMASLATKLDELSATQSEVISFHPRDASYSQLKQLRHASERLAGPAARLPAPLLEAREGLSALAVRQQVLGLETLLSGSTRPSASRAELLEVHSAFSGVALEEDTRSSWEHSGRLLADWKLVEEQTEVVDQRLAQSHSGWPIWLAKLANERGGVKPTGSSAPLIAAPMKSGPPPASASTKLAIYVVANKERLAHLEVKELTPDLDFEIRRPGGEIMKLAFKHEQTIRRNVQSANDGFLVQEHRLLPEPNAPEPPFAFIGRDNAGSGERLRIYVGFPLQEEPLWPGNPPRLERVGDLLRLIGALPMFGNAAPSFVLLTPADFDGSGKARELILNAMGGVSLAPVQGDLRLRMTTKRQEADRLAKQASEMSAGGKSLDALRPKVKAAANLLKNKVAGDLVDLTAQTPSALVGDFAKALAVDWQIETKGQSDLLQKLQEAGRSLGDAQGDLEKARPALKVVSDLLPRLGEKYHSPDQQRSLGELRNLCQSLASLLGDPKALEANTGRLNDAAQAEEKEARRIENLPLLKGGIPPGEYTLLVRLKDSPDVKLLTLIAPLP